MAIRLGLQLNKAFYEPGEPAIVTVKISNDARVAVPGLVFIRELVFHASGQERSDPSWVGKLWRPECKPEATENRRNVRTIFRTEAASLMSAAELPSGASRQFHLKFRLPTGLPPTFKGSSLRFTYGMEVRAVYELRTVVGRSPAFETLATSSLIVWPPHTWQRQPGGTGQGTGPGSDATPRHASGALGGPFGLASSLTPTPSLQTTASGGVAAGSGGGRERTSGDGSAGAAATAATAGAGAGPGAAAGLPEDVQDLPLSDYRLQQLGVKVRVVEVSSSGAPVDLLKWGSTGAGSTSALGEAEASNGRASLSHLSIAQMEAGQAGAGAGAGASPAAAQQLLSRAAGTPLGGAPSFAAWGTASPLRAAQHGAPGAEAGPGPGSGAAAAAGAAGAGAGLAVGLAPLHMPGHVRALSGGSGAGALSPSPSGAGPSGRVGTAFSNAAAVAAAAAAAGRDSIGPSALPVMTTTLTTTPLRQLDGGGSDDSETEAAGSVTGGAGASRRASGARPPLPYGADGASLPSTARSQYSGAAAGVLPAVQRQWRVSESSSGQEREPQSPHGSLSGLLSHHANAGGPGAGAFAAAAALGWPARSSSISSPAQVFGKSFVLSAGGAPVLKLTLQAPLDGHLQPGNTFGGLLDFRLASSSSPAAAAAAPSASLSAPAIRCHQVSVMLETEEYVTAQHSSRPPTAGGRSGAPRVIRVLHCEQQEVTTDCAASHFLFTIPAAATPSFRSPMVSLRWVLRFELLVGPSLDQHRSSDGRGGSGGGARSTQLQQLVWPLPLVVLPPAAVQV